MQPNSPVVADKLVLAQVFRALNFRSKWVCSVSLYNGRAGRPHFDSKVIMSRSKQHRLGEVVSFGHGKNAPVLDRNTNLNALLGSC